MPNAVIDRYRQAYPGDQRSDPELTLVLGDMAKANKFTWLEDNPDFNKEYLDLRMMLAPSLGGEFTRTIGSGIDQVQAKLYDTVGLAGRAIQEGGLFSSGLDIATGGALSRGMQSFGKEGYERNLSEASASSPTIQDVGDVRNTAEAIRYGVGLFGQQAPQLAGSILGGVAGGLAGGAIAGPPGVAAGATIGATSFSFTQNQIHGELAKQIGASDVVPTAIGVGAFSALLDSIVPLKLGHTILKGVEGKIARDYMGKVLRHVPVNALTEGTTEALQEVTAIAGEMFANRNNPTFSISPSEIRKRVVNSAVAGVLLGGATGPFEAIGGKAPGTYLADQSQPAGAGPMASPPIITSPSTPLTAAQVNATAAGQSGYVNVAQPTVDELTALAQRELAGQLTQLEKAALIRTPDMALAYETILSQLKQAAPVPPEPPLPPTEVPVPVEVPTTAVPPLPVSPPVAAPPAVDEESTIALGEADLRAEIARLTKEQSEAEATRQAESLTASEKRRLAYVALRTKAVEAALERRAKPAVAALAALPTAPVVAVAPVPATPVVPAAPALDHDEFIGNIDWDPNVKRGRPFISELPSQELVDRDNLISVITQGSRDENENTPLSQTRRITFFRNSDTGQIFGLGTYDVRTPKVVNPTKKKGGLSINKFLAQGTKENVNKKKWVPLASVRIKRNVLDMYFEMTEEQWQALSKKLAIRQAEADADTNVVASTGKKASTALVDEGLGGGKGNTVVLDEHPETGEKIEGEGGPSTEDDPPLEETGLDAEQVRSLWETIASNPGKSVRQIIQENAANLAEILKGWQGTTTQILDALDRAFDQSSFGQFYEAFDPNGYKLYQSTPGAGTSPRTDIGGENGPVEGINLSVPEGAVAPLLPLAEVRARFNQVVQALREFGIGVEGYNALVRWVDGRLKLSERGSYNSQSRVVALAMFDMVNPSPDNLRMAMHEAAHPLFDSLPVPIQRAVAKAINSIDVEALGLLKSPDPRINPALRAALPESRRPEPLLSHELTVEQFAEALAIQGVEKPVAMDIAAKLFRFLKDLYYQAMMGLQQAFGRNPSPELAWAYAQNRFNQLLSNSYDAKSIFNIAMAPAPVAEQAKWYEPIDPNALPKVNPDGTVTYPMMVPDTQAARDFNILHSTPETEVEYGFEGGPRLLDYQGGPVMQMDRRASLRQVRDPVSWMRTPAEVQARITAANERMDAELKAKGIMKYSMPETEYGFRGGPRMDSPHRAVGYRPGSDQHVDRIMVLIDEAANGYQGRRFRVTPAQRQAQIDASNKRIEAELKKNGLIKYSQPETEMEYYFYGGPGIRSGTRPFPERIMAIDRPSVRTLDRGMTEDAPDWDRMLTPAQAQRAIEISNVTFEKDLKEKGIIKYSMPEPPEELKYSQPEYVGTRENPATVPETQIAAFNAQRAAEALILPELEKNGRIMAIVGDRRKTDPNFNALSWFRNEFGLEDPNLLIREQLRRPDGQGGSPPVNARPDASVDSFTSEVNRQHVARAAYSLLASARDRIGKKQANALIGINEAEEARVKAAQELQDSARDYLNFEGLTKLMTTQVKFILGRLFRDLRAESFNLGVVAQQLQTLAGGGSDLTPYLAEFRSLTRAEGTYPRLMALLDRMANDPAIDLNASITAIKAAMLPNPAYSDLTSGLPSGDAMLATLVAYAKTSPRLTTLLALRRMTNTAQRTAISAQVQTLLRQGLAVATRGPNRLTKISSIEERLKAAFQADKRAVEALQAKKAKQELQVQAAGPAIRLFDDAANRLAGRIGLHAPAVIGQGMTFWVPPTFNATWEEVTRNPKKLQLDTNLEPVDAKTQALAAQVGITLDQPTGPTPRSVLEDYIGKMNDWLAWKVSNKDIDGHYFEVKAQRDELLSNGVFSPRVINTSYTMLGLKFSDAATQAKAFGTPGARLLGKVLNHFSQILGSLKPDGHRQGVKNERLRSEAVAILSKGTKMGVSLENYLVHFYNPAWTILHRNRDILELSSDKERQWDIAFQRILARFQQGGVTNPLIAGKELRFMTAFRKHMESEWASSKATVNTLENKGVGVADESLPMTTPAGERVPGVRLHIGEGVATMPSTISNTFSLVVEVLKKLNWAAFSEILKTKGDSVMFATPWLDQVIQPFFNNADVQEYFFKAFTDTDTITSFTGPKLSDKETRPEANPNYAAKAYEDSKGSIRAFIQRMYDLHDGDPENQTLDEYGMDILRTFSRLFGQMNKVNGEINPDTRDDSHVIAEWKTMIPGFMVNALVIKHWPSIYRNYLMFDRRTMFRVNARVAAEIAFGVEQGRIANAYEVALKEAAVGIQRLDNAKAKVENTLISASRKEIEAAMAAEVGGKETLKRLRKLQQRTEKFLSGPKSIRAELFTFFRGADSPVRTVRFLNQLLGLFSSMMLNQPGSAIGQLADLFAPIMTFGVSPAMIRQVTRTIGISGIDVTTGLLTPLGLNFALTDRMQQRYNELGQDDPLALAKLKDLMLRETSPFDGTKMNMIIAGMRKLQEAQEFGIGKKKNPRTVARLAAPFRWISMVVSRGNVCSTWNTVNDYVARGMKAYQSGISASDDELANWTPEQWAKEMDMGRADANSFRTMTTLMLDDWGLDFFRLVREGIANVKENKDALSDATLMRVQGMVLKEVTSETAINTMPLASFNSSAIKSVSFLLGWPFRRAMDVAGSFKDVNGRASWAAVGNSMLAMAVMGAGGLGVSMLVDLYNEEALRKRRNLRRLTLDDPANFAMAVVEHSARVGTTGLFGDIINEIVNVGTGEGANRGVSLDQRIVFMSSILGIWRSFSTLANQGFQADYAGVIRPLAYSMGGNGAMQYMQLMNGVFQRAGADPLFEREAAATQRTNVGNWLRAAGRQLDFEIETSRGGYGSPTATTPFISRMVLAAYSDDPSAFSEAYRDAINEARTSRKMDITDATSYVKRAFSSRHPLRATFRSTLGVREYRDLLNAMPDAGSDSVQEAVGLFNVYGSRLSIEPFAGKEPEKPKNILRIPTLPRINTTSLRSLAVGAALR